MRLNKSDQMIYVCNDFLGVVSMHYKKVEGLTAARELLNKEPDIKELFVCDWMNRFKPIRLQP